MVYLGHRSFLPPNHSFHHDRHNFPHRKDPTTPPANKTQDFIDLSNKRYAKAVNKKDKTEIVQKYERKGEYAPRKLPYHDRILSTPVEPMHVVKDVVEHIVQMISEVINIVKVRNEKKCHGRFHDAWVDHPTKR